MGRDRLDSSYRPQPASPPALGVVAALMTAGWHFLDHLYRPARPSVALGAMVLGFLILAWSFMRQSRFRFRLIARLLAIGVLSLACLASADRVLIGLEALVPPLGIFAKAVVPLLNGEGYPAEVTGGELHIVHPEGLLTICPSCDKLSIRPLVELWCLWMVLRIVLDRRRLLTCAAMGALTLFIAALVRFAACVLVYVEYDNILEGHGGYDALSLFSDPAVDAIALIASGMVLEVICRRLLSKTRFEPPVALPIRSAVLYFAGSLGLAMLVGFAGACTPPGPQKSGRILFDDRFCGVWEPTARLLDTEWYGDFSTYSFSSLAEWLGHWFVVDVNTRLPYTSELLSRYDILILKTPVQPIPEAERKAIDRFVTSGGGLLLVGDHTNLLGMGTHLNSLCAKHGIRFRYDSVSDAMTGGFVDYFAPSIGRHAGALHVKHLQFMTSCSLQLDSRAEPIITATACRRDPHDYANPSFFGRQGPHPELSDGSVVLAATAAVGRGRIAAFTDSTVWSSFAVFQFDREKLAADLIQMLNRKPSPFRLPLRVIMLITLCVAMVIGVRRVRAEASLPVFLGGLLGVWGGVYGADQAHLVFYDAVSPRSPVSEVSFLWQGGSCAFPPVLGSVGSLPMDRAFDTLLVSVQRLGLVPRVAYTYDQDLLTPNTRSLVVIAPVDHPPQSMLSRIESFVRRGGSLIVMDDGRLGGTGSAADYMRLFQIDLHYTQRAGPKGEPLVHSSLSGLTPIDHRQRPDTFLGHRAYGAGHVVYLREASHFSRASMGHCFTRPGKVARGSYEMIFWIFRDLLGLAPGDRKYYGLCE